MFHIAATIGITVGELEDKLSFSEYLDWLEYLAHNNKPAGGQPNMLDSPDDLLKGFGF